MIKTGIVLASLCLFVGHAAFGAQSYGIIGDSGQETSLAKMSRQSILRSGVRKLILPGDNLYDLSKSYDEIWQRWTDLGFTFDVVAIGNHTLGYKPEMAFFKMPEEYYAKVEDQARFLVLNSDHQSNAQEQADWLEMQLSSAREKFVFVTFHHPPSTISDRHTWQEKKKFFQKIRPVLMRNASKITALIVGHDHIASILSWANIPLIVSGAAAESLRPKYINSNEDGIPVKTLWKFNDTAHWARIDLLDNSEAWLMFIDSKSDKISCSVQLAPVFQLRSNCAN